MRIETVREAYARRAGEYISRLGSIDATALVDQELIEAWGRSVHGPVLDVGCGPGHWAGFLHQAGVEVTGIDPVPEFIDHARARFPDVPVQVGRAEVLDVDDASVGGILAWYSLIHAHPARISSVFDEFARALRPGGTLLVGFFAGADLTEFDHAVTTAYFWPTDALRAVIEDAGFTVVATHTRTDPGARRHGDLIAQRLRS
ncbi:class I SAM-dependent methyltransferase [Georgenia sp. TF02-10]|uniref:class I SAM-dependent methyltransferase n=1 Tax=Georgenia sp. TF02-10 TaxID=2917725 RepID=UPI001FA79DFB|nr:class I SAM-dependent methyltransferase [Georgenia sp. TF02-10]UNX55469.1 class I SAM-dependent methyltransferase [Georgenia sp. TF02-10]